MNNNNRNNNNNNNNNNRRRGRGGNRGPTGGGNQFNRIDSRARGNAPQMLEKYKKMAQDALLNDDRVQAEYYLQFADHYFRVVSDGKVQKDEARAKRDDEREQSSDDDDADFSREDQGGGRRPRGNRDRDRDEGTDTRSERRPDARNESRPESDSRSEPESGDDARTESQSNESDDGDAADSNPFVRDTPAPKRRPRARAKPAADKETAVSDGVNLGALPPAISRDESAAPRKPLRARPRRSRPDEDGDGETLEVVS